MELADRIEALWLVLLADSPEGVRARQRAAATAAMGIFLAVMLLLVGLTAVVVVLASLVASFVIVVGSVLLTRRYAGHAIARLGRFRVSTKGTLSTVADRTARASTATRARVGARIPTYRERYSRAHAVAAQHLATATTQAHRHARSAASAVAASAKEAWPTRTPMTRQREAVRANAAGVQLRREGAYDEAAEQHRFALEIFRELGDRRSEALTLNNLALALDRADDAAALDLFEEAAAILRELGEEEHEGKVIANLGMAFRRRGRDEQSAQVFELALGKLDPESDAYRQVDRLRRAS